MTAGWVVVGVAIGAIAVGLIGAVLVMFIAAWRTLLLPSLRSELDGFTTVVVAFIACTTTALLGLVVVLIGYALR